MTDAIEATSNGRHAREEGNFPKAREHYAVAANIYRERNDLLAYAHSIRHIADIFQQEHNAIEAKPLYEEALELYRSNLHTKLLDLVNTIRPYALLIEQEGYSDSARALWEEARNLYGSLRLDVGVSECATHISRLQRLIARHLREVGPKTRLFALRQTLDWFVPAILALHSSQPVVRAARQIAKCSFTTLAFTRIEESIAAIAFEHPPSLQNRPQVATMMGNVNTILLGSLPYHDTERLVMLFSVSPDHFERLNGVSVPDLYVWRERRNRLKRWARRCIAPWISDRPRADCRRNGFKASS